jgi:hypothetical protein
VPPRLASADVRLPLHVKPLCPFRLAGHVAGGRAQGAGRWCAGARAALIELGWAGIAAGVLGTAATWVASTGSRAAGREAQTPRLVGA